VGGRYYSIAVEKEGEEEQEEIEKDINYSLCRLEN